MTDIDHLCALIAREERFLPKFPVGSAQHSLLANRIRSLEIARDLLLGTRTPSPEELRFALPRVESIIHKLSAALEKHAEDSPTHRRMAPTLQTMRAVQSALAAALPPERT